MSSTTKHRKEMKWSKSVPESFAPLEYDEDIEIELPRSVKICLGHKQDRNCSIMDYESMLPVEHKRVSGGVVERHVIPETVIITLRKIAQKKRITRREYAEVIDFIMTCTRISKTISNKFRAQKIGVREVFRIAGLFTIRL